MLWSWQPGSNGEEVSYSCTKCPPPPLYWPPAQIILFHPPKASPVCWYNTVGFWNGPICCVNPLNTSPECTSIRWFNRHQSKCIHPVPSPSSWHHLPPPFYRCMEKGRHFSSFFPACLPLSFESPLLAQSSTSLLLVHDITLTHLIPQLPHHSHSLTGNWFGSVLEHQGICHVTSPRSFDPRIWRSFYL